jgi:4,5-DOPA dioxygenase extradiol
MDKKELTRRESLGLIGAAGAVAVGGAVVSASASGSGAPRLAGSGGGGVASRPSSRLPVLFVAHGAPPLLDMPDWVGQLNTWAGALARPKAILMLSAHWENRPTTLGATTTVPLIYDFFGFPEHHYRQTYAAPGAPALASRVRELLGAAGQPVADDPRRGLDHGAYVPLVAMYPSADIPVLQASLPSLEPRELLALGQALAPLRDEGVLIIGSGFLTHNLRGMDPRPGALTPGWASDFDAWNTDVLLRGDVDSLLDYRAKAPGVKQSLPSHEHFAPIVVAQGAAGADKPSFPIEGWWMGSLSKRSMQFGG